MLNIYLTYRKDVTQPMQLNTLMQGDAYTLPFTGSGFTAGDVTGCEITLGSLTKCYPGEVTFDAATLTFGFPLSQSESFALSGLVKCQLRLKLGSCVIGVDLGRIDVTQSLSKEVL